MDPATSTPPPEPGRDSAGPTDPRTPPPAPPQGGKHNPWRVVLAAWVASRLAVATGFAFAHLLSGGRNGEGLLHLREGLVTWDGDWYRALARDGWSAWAPDSYRFFPLHPLLGRALGPLIGIGPALVIVANIASVVGLWATHRLVTAVTDDEDLGDRSTWAMALFPAAAMYAFAYSEGLALALGSGYLWAVARRRWGAAFVLGCLAATTRPVGILLGVAPLLAAVGARAGMPRGRESEPPPPSRENDRTWPGSLLAAAGPVAGLGIVIAWVGVATGDPTLPLDIQKRLRRGFADPISRTVQMVLDVGRGSGRDAFNLAFLAVLLAGGVWGARRFPRWLTGWAALSVLIALSARNVDSLGRYGMILVPALGGWGVALHTRGRLVAAGTVAWIGSVGFTVAVLWGKVVP